MTILQMVNGWLQHAEAKNAGLVALDSVGIAGILSYLASTAQVSTLLLTGFVVTGFLLVLSLGIALRSFQPRVRPGELLTAGAVAREATDNLYFYGDLQKYRPEQLAQAVAQLYGGVRDYDASRHRSHTDLAQQIIVNSRITVIKNGHFRVATWFTIAALGTAVLFVSLNAFLSR